MPIIGCILLVLIVVSIYLAYSDYLPGRAYLGWTLLAIFLVFYLEFWGLWSRRLDGPFEKMFAVIVLALILATQGPLLLQLISLSVLPNPSRGLKLVKAYSEAEKKVTQDDLPGAIAEYEKVIAEDPDDVVARFRLAELCYQNADYRKAALAYETLVKRVQKLDVNQHCSALTRLSEIYLRNLGDVENARKQIQTIIDTYPGTKYAKYATDRLANL